MANNPPVTPADYARTRGLSRATVNRYLKRGLPTVQADGRRLLDVEAADAWRERCLSKHRGGTRTVKAAAPPPTPPTPQELAAIGAAARDPDEFYRVTSQAEASRLKECARALQEIRKSQRDNVSWITVDDAISVFERYLSSFRARLLDVPGAVADQANVEHPATAKQAVQRAIVEAMTDLSGAKFVAEAVQMRATRETARRRRAERRPSR